MAPSRRTFLGALAAAALALAAGSAAARPHEATRGAHTLRASVVRSTDIAQITARGHGIRPSPRRAVLNVTLLRHDARALTAVPAKVSARVRDLLGASHSLRLREVRAGGRVSYLGDFVHQSGETLDFDIAARPAAGGAPLRLQFRERMPLRRGAR